MGRLSVSEALCGAQKRLQREPGQRPLARQTTFIRQRLVSASPTGLHFEGRTAAEAPILLSPLLLILASFPWISPERVDAGRALVSVVCIAAAFALLHTSWPRRIRIQLSPSMRELRCGSECWPVAAEARWKLGTAQGEFAPYPHYFASLGPGHGQERLLIVDRDPAAVLRQLHEALLYWPGSVESSWGLPDEAQPWLFDRAGSPRDSAAPTGSGATCIAAPLARADLRLALLVMTALVLIDLTFLLVSASATVGRVQPLSVLLAIWLGTCLVILSLAIAGAEARLYIGARVAGEVRALGWGRRPGPALAVTAVRGVYVVGAVGAERRHLLVDSTEGPLSLSVPSERAEELVHRVTQALGSNPKLRASARS